ncbi:hypothetical protein GALMADRAFT_883991 [Galerina marginata CBS 339.88]|uniref:Uncharacterized protein n=1 Tax=Galerina marginata (strain CBS 339.88) TaxID=685588 RepID=A0A067SHK1_GALM3|nr:hypothetical protein GALMADRAFT_883991 [Galerina marginata CBS 339.88]
MSFIYGTDNYNYSSTKHSEACTAFLECVQGMYVFYGLCFSFYLHKSPILTDYRLTECLEACSAFEVRPCSQAADSY